MKFDSYPIFNEIFDKTKLIEKKSETFYPVYQLLRNAAVRRKLECQMVVLIDDRRKDLNKLFDVFVSSVKREDERNKIHLITWQEIKTFFKVKALDGFLKVKYDI